MSMQYRRQKIYTKVYLWIVLACLSCTQAQRANMSVFNFSDFGPEIVSYELIGHEWYQWNSRGPDDPEQIGDVKVVVYRNIPLEKVKEVYPVIKDKQDYRYLEYSQARAHLNQFEQDPFWKDYPETKEKMRKTRKES
jgi:hypothetical protein